MPDALVHTSVIGPGRRNPPLTAAIASAWRRGARSIVPDLRPDLRGRRAAAVLIAALWTAIVAARFVVVEPVEATLFLLTVPIALAAVVFGARGGLLLALMSTAAFASWVLLAAPTLGILGLLTRPTVFLAIGLGAGWMSDRTQRAHALLHALVDQTSDAVVVKDAESRYVLVNPAAARLLGHPVSELLGRSDDDLLEAGLAADRLLAVEDPPDGETLSEECEVHHDSLGRRVLLATRARLHDGRGRAIGVYVVAHDVTDRHRVLEHERRRATSEAAEYERARADYERLMRHRIANPLAIATGVAMTLRDVRIGDVEVRRSLLDALVASVDDLSRISLDRSAISQEERNLQGRAQLRSLGAGLRAT